MTLKLTIIVLLTSTCSVTHVLAQPAQTQKVEPLSNPSSNEKPSTNKTTGPQGGNLKKIDDLEIEIVVDTRGLRLYAYDSKQNPLDLRDARGLITLKIAGEAKRFRHDLYPEHGKDGIAKSLMVIVDLSRFSGQQVEMTTQLVGFSKIKKKPIQFATRTQFPLTQAQQVAAAIAAQKICPVSKQPLGSMGKPLAVQVGDQTVYVCCASCTKALQTNPVKFLANLAKQPLPSVEKATPKDTHFVAAQKLCPVMDKPLDAMGGPYKTVVQGRLVFLCCPGCAKKLHATPEAFFNKLAERGITPPAVNSKLIPAISGESQRDPLR